MKSLIKKQVEQLTALRKKLHQHAEETGQGARRILRNKKFRSLKPDLVFALHNLPGYPLGQVLIRKDTFYCASTGIVITLKGRTSHAAHPENGISPGFAVSELISALPRLSLKKELKNIYSLITITHVTIGERSLGIAPGDAVIMAALRAESDADLHMIAKLTEAHVHNTADMHSLQCYISWSETFPATVNHAQACDIIEHSASECGYSLRHLHTPLKVSEDFGEFTARYPGAILGIGSGENHPQLYNPGFDFPDRLIDIGCNMFMNIINKGVQS